MKRRAFYQALGVVGLLTASCRRVSLPSVRALWVSRFEYGSPADVERIMRHAAEIGFTDIFFQVRAKGTVYYSSAVEPWAYELSGRDPVDTGIDPGWNPLRLASEVARRLGVRIHAYANVLPGWHAPGPPPAESGQLWATNPDWFMVDRLGARMDSTLWYSFLNPAHPEVRSYLVRLFSELATFRLDGIHLDYIRYPDDFHEFAPRLFPDADKDELKARSDFSYDPVSLHRFGKDPAEHPRDWNQFRRAAVTDLVRMIAEAVRKIKPELCLSASIIARPSTRPECFQEGLAWGRAGLLNWVVPMIYQDRGFEATLAENIKKLGRRKAGTQLIVGIYAKHDVARMLEQIERVKAKHARGVAVFSFGALVEGDKKTAKGEALRRYFSSN
jgi:uncharacterized lipoprotein YddW (UPF0748 family)